MLKKIERGAYFIQTYVHLFRCPRCHKAMTAEKNQLTCENGHTFDLSKKGTLYFLERQVKTDYDNRLFVHRQKMIQAGMYGPILDFLAPHCEKQRLLDVGCGEGSFLNEINNRVATDLCVGFDISKAGVYLATDQPNDAFWCVADLTNLPFQDNSFSVVLNIFSPSNYHEFRRVLKKGGKVIKVVPGTSYLKELRQAFYPEDQDKQNYSNQAVVTKFAENFNCVKKKQISYEFMIPKNVRYSLLEMSPLEWQVSETRKADLRQKPLEKVTVDLTILIGTT